MDQEYLVRRVAVLVETEDSWGCSVIRGIADYSQDHGHWNLLIDPRDQEQRLLLPDLWDGDGIIARLGSQTQLEQIRGRSEPKINVDTIFEGIEGFYDVITDDNQRAELALAHLRDRGFEHFAYFAPPSPKYSDKRGRAFIETVERAGYSCRVYKPRYRAGRKIGWEEQQRRVSRWLKSLPSPVAILTVDAHQGRQLADICYFSGIRVPDEVAILAGDTDELMCDVCTPPLSSISLAARRIGFEAAALLDRLMNGEKPEQKSYRIPPLRVISRHSTDIMAIDDEAVVRALRFIHTHAFQDIVVKDILNEVPISRRSLEIQFQHYLGRSPAEEIRRVRLDKGRELLARSEMSIGEIAVACGFANSTRFGVSFRKKYGQTPLAYRKQLLRTNT
ncbi:AraC family transcriptional regulator [Bythopirellula polymerisocia]|uniref:Xylose operon regulatory protein n=1 Tax=Bythopirellula polymerisocia TaxID=2528003 RepID=A0A5C6CJI9_9BACT|nr:XylR family transcriptional regulator [Bythopirellula polymerisocia]TWU24522.1 Xylose operon regulatory protein [Bythopirellula polymerisocia]